MPVSSSSYSISSRDRAPVCLDQVAIGILRLRILVEVLHVRVGRRAVEVEVIFLDVFAMVAFGVGQAEQRSFRMGSRPFHKANAKQSRCLSSEIPARPSSPQR